MEKQKVLFGIIVTLLFSFLMISGCTQQNQSKNQPPTTESIQTILAKAETIGSMYCEIAGNTSGFETQTTMVKIWQKTPYLKENMTNSNVYGTTTISIIKRPEGIYTYNTTQNKYVLNTTSTINPQSSREMAKDLIDNRTLTNLGTETIDGKTATIIQYTNTTSGGLITVKMWIWNERGVPLKALYTGIAGPFTVTMDYEYSNYSFSDIPDSTFSVS